MTAVTRPTVPAMTRSAIGAFLLALFVGILSYWALPQVPQIGHILTLLGWIVTLGLVIYGVYLLVAGRRA